MKEKGWEPVYQEKGDIYKKVMPKIKKYASIFKKKKYERILDLGCGTGRNTIYLAQKGFEVYALDASKTGVAITKKKAKSLDLTIKYKVADIKHTSYPNDFFDAIVCNFVLSHGLLSDNKKAVKEIYRILKPKGMLITEFLSRKDKTYGKGKKIEKNTYLGSMEDDRHMMHHYFSKKEIRKILSKFTSFNIAPKTYFGEVNAFDIEATK